MQCYVQAPLIILSTLEGKNMLLDGANSLLSGPQLTLLHSEWPKLYGVLAILSAKGLKDINIKEKILVLKWPAFA